MDSSFFERDRKKAETERIITLSLSRNNRLVETFLSNKCFLFQADKNIDYSIVRETS
jgi:hypothetical protein